MKHIILKPQQEIELIAKENSTIMQAVVSSIEFIKKHNLKASWLYFQDYTILIDKDSNINQIVSDYNNYLQENLKK